jgi:Zn-dependent M16 (insulinase) family peptidase
MSFVNQALKGVPQTHNIDVLEKFQDVTIDDVLRILNKYFLPLFDAKGSVVVSVTAPGKADEVADGLKAVGYSVERRTLDVEPDEGSDEYETGSESGNGSENSH